MALQTDASFVSGLGCLSAGFGAGVTGGLLGGLVGGTAGGGLFTFPSLLHLFQGPLDGVVSVLVTG